MHRIICFALVIAVGSFAAPTFGDDAPRRVALLVGVNKYLKPGFSDLQFAEADVLAVSKELEKLGFSVTLLLGSEKGERQATRENIEAAALEMVRPLGKQDVALVMLSGHGQQLKVPNGAGRQKDESFYCPVDARVNDPATQFSLSYLLDDILAPNVGRKMLLVDACRDVPVDPSKGARSAKGIDGRVIELPEDTAVFFSCRAGQQSFERHEIGHGLFTFCVLEALRGEAANGGTIAWSSLVAHVDRRMQEPDITKYMPRAMRQVPIPAGAMPYTVLGAIKAASPAPAPAVAKVETPAPEVKPAPVPAAMRPSPQPTSSPSTTSSPGQSPTRISELGVPGLSLSAGVLTLRDRQGKVSWSYGSMAGRVIGYSQARAGGVAIITSQTVALLNEASGKESWRTEIPHGRPYHVEWSSDQRNVIVKDRLETRHIIDGYNGRLLTSEAAVARQEPVTPVPDGFQVLDDDLRKLKNLPPGSSEPSLEEMLGTFNLADDPLGGEPLTTTPEEDILMRDLLGLEPSPAQPKRPAAQVFVEKEGAEVKVGEQVIARLSRRATAPAFERRGSWIRVEVLVRGEVRQGWILADDVKVHGNLSTGLLD